MVNPSADQIRLEAIIAGDMDAFRSLVCHYHPLAYNVAYRLLDDAQDAEEIVQDAFVKVHGGLEGFRGEAALKTWILRIVMRLSLNRRRDRARSAWRRLGLHRRTDDAGLDWAPVPAQTGGDPEAIYLSRQMRRRVRRWIEDLPTPLRQAMVLSSIEELSYEEIAHVLQIPVGTVSSRIHSARKKLLAKFRQYELV
jgi:RNA polymerase sigma-70 factor, ECF subfamily